MNWLQRVEVIVLALMLVHIVVVVINVSYRYRLACRAEVIDTASSAFQRGRRKLVADLSMTVGTLNSIALVAPYIGLAGTSSGIWTGLQGISIVADSAWAAVIAAGTVTVAFVTTVAGLLVAIPAAWCYNYLRTRINLLEVEISGDVHVGRGRRFRVAQKFPLAPRYSTIPFPVVAAPILAILVGVLFMEYCSYQTPMGLSVSVVPARCEYEDDDRLIVLRLTDAGKLFINQTQEDWNSLPELLSKIYGLRAHRTLYLLAEDRVPFQTVADALDIVESASVEPHQAVRTRADKLDITVRLITPKAMNASCVIEPVAIGSSQHASRLVAKHRDFTHLPTIIRLVSPQGLRLAKGIPFS